jgi:hypothetical protein
VIDVLLRHGRALPPSSAVVRSARLVAAHSSSHAGDGTEHRTQRDHAAEETASFRTVLVKHGDAFHVRDGVVLNQTDSG